VLAGRFDDVPPEHPFPGVTRRGFDTNEASVTRYDFDAGARFPLHRHPQEQITIVEEGDVELTAGDETRALRAGQWAVVPPDVPHGIRAGTGGARFLAIVVPRRASSGAYELAEPEG
jgi:quercetin dioxygenase-like cupin family protein